MTKQHDNAKSLAKEISTTLSPGYEPGYNLDSVEDCLNRIAVLEKRIRCAARLIHDHQDRILLLPFNLGETVEITLGAESKPATVTGFRMQAGTSEGDPPLIGVDLARFSDDGQVLSTFAHPQQLSITLGAGK